MKKGAKFPGFTQDDILGYNPDTEAETWQVYCVFRTVRMGGGGGGGGNC